MADIRHAQCHCGAVTFTVELSDGLNTARRCSCSFCRMRGAVVVSAPLSGITVRMATAGFSATSLFVKKKHNCRLARF